MNPLSVTRRRAEAFDAALRAGEAPARDARTAELLTLVSALRASSAPEARPAFVSDLREQLMLAAATELRPAPRPVDRATDRLAPPVLPRVRPARERRLAAALAGFALVGASATMAVAAQSSLPGDTLYSLKRVIEDADTTLRADGDQGRRLLQHASNRLVELQALADPDRDTTSPPVLESTLDTFVEQADEASVVLLDDYAETGEAEAVNRLHVFAAESLDILGRLQPVLPASVRPELRDAAESLVRIDAAADRACPECAAGGIVESNLMSATALDPAPTPTPEAAVPAPVESAPAPPVQMPEQPPTRQPAQSPATQPPVTPRPPATAPTNPPASPRPPRDTSPPVPPVPAPPVPTPTRGGLVGGLLDDLTGGGQGPAPTTPSPTPLLPGLGGLRNDTLGGLGSTADQLLS